MQYYTCSNRYTVIYYVYTKTKGDVKDDKRGISKRY